MLIVKHLADLPVKSVPWLQGTYDEIQLWVLEGQSNGVTFENLAITITASGEQHREMTGTEFSTSMWAVDGEFCEKHQEWEYELPRAFSEQKALLGVSVTTDHEAAIKDIFSDAIGRGELVVQEQPRA